MLRKLMLAVLIAIPFSLAAPFAGEAMAASKAAGEPGWTHGVVLFGEAREKKDATPILAREYRPFHFYGNTVRRQYYRGSVRPTLSDGLQMIRVTITRD